MKCKHVRYICEDCGESLVLGNQREDPTPFEAFSPGCSATVVEVLELCPACPGNARAVREPCDNCGHSCEHACSKVIEVNETAT